MTFNEYGVYTDLAVPFAFPIGTIFMTVNKAHYDRTTFIHEMAHHIMYIEANFDSISDIAFQFVYDVATTGQYHADKLLSDPKRALLEGWPRGIDAIFEYTPIPEYYFVNNNLWDGLVEQNTNLGPNVLIPVDRGERSEGAFANILFFIFWNQVVNGLAPINRLSESTTGDIAENNAWIKDHKLMLSNLFKLYIWEPLKNLDASGFMNAPETTEMLENILSNDVFVRHKLLKEMERWNIQVRIPAMVSLSTYEGPVAGGNQIQIYGYNFTESHTASVDQANVLLNVFFWKSDCNKCRCSIKCGNYLYCARQQHSR